MLNSLVFQVLNRKKLIEVVNMLGAKINLLRGIEEKASRFSAGMNPPLPFTVHRSMARLDIPRCVNAHLQVIVLT